MAIEVVQVPDDALALAATVNGPSSAEAQILACLKALRARDRQVFAFRVGDYLIAGPVPDPLPVLTQSGCRPCGPIAMQQTDVVCAENWLSRSTVSIVGRLSV